MSESRRSRARRADGDGAGGAEALADAGAGGDAGDVGCRHVPAVRELLRMYHGAARVLHWGAAGARRCGACGRRGGAPLYACLQCATYGCWPPGAAPEKTHLAEHTAATGHALSIETGGGALWCAVCRVSVWTDRLAAVWGAAAHSPGAHCAYADAVGVAEDAAGGECAPFGRRCVLPRGLYNLGNTCYMNSVLQMLFATPALRRHVLGPGAPLRAAVSGHVHAADASCASCELDALFVSLADGGTAPVVPARLLAALWRSFPRDLAGYAQQDAHEFLTALRQALHGALRRPAPGGCECVVHATLGGTLRSDVACPSCGAVTSTRDPFLDISLDVPPTGTAQLEECLAAFSRPEDVSLHGGRYACAACGASAGEIRKQLYLERLPPVLTLHLKRFKHGGGRSKVETPVSAPLVLDAAAAMAPGARPAHYHLYGLVAHAGSLDAGHYTAYVRGAAGAWLHADDGAVALVPWDGCVSAVGAAYLLFYAADEAQAARAV